MARKIARSGLQTSRTVPELSPDESVGRMRAVLKNSAAPRLARATACRVLARLGGARDVPLLLKQLRTAPEHLVYWEAAKALGLLGAGQHVDMLGRFVAGRAEPNRRAAGAYVLGMLGDSAAVPYLLRALQDAIRSAVVRAHAAEALGVLKARQARLALAHSLETDRSPRVRAAAAYALGRIGDRRDLRVLEGAGATDRGEAAYVGKVRSIALDSAKRIRAKGRG